MDTFYTIESAIAEEITEKKSKFIADLIPVATVEEAEKRIEEIKKKYYDAKHHCFAYRILEQDKVKERASDDGEPSGTAGAPMLTILNKNELCNVLIVVTRYFGGILLGTGGLVRAYSEAMTKALESSKKRLKQTGYELFIEIGYEDVSKFQYFCRKQKIAITNVEYLDNVTFQVEVTEKIKDEFMSKSYNFSFQVLKWNIIRQKYIDANIDI